MPNVCSLCFHGLQAQSRAAATRQFTPYSGLVRTGGVISRLGLLTVTAVHVDPDLRHATVLMASISDEARAALEEDRVRLQSAVARQLRLKRTPRLSFDVDPAITTGARIEDILRGLRDDEH